MKWVSVEKKGRIAIVRFDRGNKANALSLELMRELTEAARQFELDAQTSAVVLTGRLESFCLGADLTDPQAQALREGGLAERRQAMMTGARMCKAWEDIQALTISAIEGWCVGGGVALAVATDLRVMGESAGLYVPEIERGMNMSWGSVPRITNLAGPARAKRIVILAEKLDAARATAWGMADETAPDGAALERALELADVAAGMPPVALRMCKQDINAYANALAHVASHSDYDQFILSQTSADFHEGVSAFLDKRPANYTGE